MTMNLKAAMILLVGFFATILVAAEYATTDVEGMLIGALGGLITVACVLASQE